MAEPLSPPEPQAAGPPPGNQAHAAPMTEQGAHQYAMFIHLSGLVAVLGVPSVIGPLVMWLVKRDAHPFVDDQGKEALNFHLLVLIVSVVVGFLMVPAMGLGAIFFLPIFGLALLAFAAYAVVLIFVILASVEASKGHAYRYPLNWRIVK